MKSSEKKMEPIHELMMNIKTYIDTVLKYEGGLSTPKLNELMTWCKKNPELVKVDVLKNRMIRIKKSVINHLDLMKNEINKITF